MSFSYITLASIPSPPFDRIEIGPFTFRMYGLMIALGVVAGVELARSRWAAKGGDPDDVIEVVKWAVPAGLIGARLYHVITDWTRYQGRWGEAFYIWRGGLGIPGGLLLGVLVAVLVVRRRGIDLGEFGNAVIPGIPVAQAIGRLGNWFNQEIFGPPTTAWWGLEIDPAHRPASSPDAATYQPTFLFEALWNLALAATLIWADNRKFFKPGQMMPAWITGYGVGRFLVESVRRDEASMILDIRVNHWVSAVAVVIGVTWFVIVGRNSDDAVTSSDAVSGSDAVASSDGESDPADVQTE